jgi:hypothetical protein
MFFPISQMALLDHAERFNHRILRDFVIHQLQADEIRTFAGTKKQVIWVLTTLEVWKNDKDSSAASRTDQQKALLPRRIHKSGSLLCVLFNYCSYENL